MGRLNFLHACEYSSCFFYIGAYARSRRELTQREENMKVLLVYVLFTFSTPIGQVQHVLPLPGVSSIAQCERMLPALGYAMWRGTGLHGTAQCYARVRVHIPPRRSHIV